MQRFRAVLLAFLLAAAMLAAAPSGSAAPAATLEFWTISLKPDLTAHIEDVIRRYQQAHDGIRIKWVDVDYQVLDQKLLSAIAGGVGPDVVNLNTELTVRMAQARALVDMDAAVPADVRARYFPNIWASLRVGGRAYGIPWYVEPDVLAYNRALFRRAGLDPARPAGPGCPRPPRPRR